MLALAAVLIVACGDEQRRPYDYEPGPYDDTTAKPRAAPAPLPLLNPPVSNYDSVWVPQRPAALPVKA